MSFVNHLRRRWTTLPWLINPPPQLQRQNVRVPIRSPVTVVSGGGPVACHTINVSAGGVLLDKRIDGFVGARVDLQVEGYSRVFAARVVRLGAHATALSFVSQRHGLAALGLLRAATKAG